MKIINFGKQHIEEAKSMVLVNYQEEQQVVADLPMAGDLPDLIGFAENGLGVAAFDGQNMVGFLCCSTPFENAFGSTDVKGVFSPLLNFTISTLKAEGYTKLGVDFESFNPTAYGFWLKYFTAYTHSVVRRIDERITKI